MSEHARIIVEGEFKAVHLWQIGVAAMGLPAGGLTKEIAYALRDRHPLILLRDNDGAGFCGALKAKRLLPGLQVISTPSEKAIDDYLIKEGMSTWIQRLVAGMTIDL